MIDSILIILMVLLVVPAIVLPAAAIMEVWFSLRGRDYIQPIEQISKENDYE